MTPPAKILVFHTAFIGDVILLLPMIQVLRKHSPDAVIDVVAIPSAAEVLPHHPAINSVIVYDKKGVRKGVGHVISIAGELREAQYDVVITPHRSLRSAAIGWLAGIPRRIGFNKSAGRMLLTDVVRYEEHVHEIRRNLNLLKPLGIETSLPPLPTVHPDDDDQSTVDGLLQQHPVSAAGRIIAIAPGSVWNTKRWQKERFTELCRLLLAEGFSLALIGGKEDSLLGSDIEHALHDERVMNVAGRLTLLQSAELLRRCDLLVSNDSAPMHLAVAVRTPVVAVFGATVPAFGFAPVGELDAVVETSGLSCRPCSIHGGRECPIGTFECMTAITARRVLEGVHAILANIPVEA